MRDLIIKIFKEIFVLLFKLLDHGGLVIFQRLNASAYVTLVT